jgi:hypothetical protein
MRDRKDAVDLIGIPANLGILERQVKLSKTGAHPTTMQIWRSIVPKTSRSALIAIFAVVCAAGSVAAKSNQIPPPEAAPEIKITAKSHTFTVWGDIRFTDPANCEKSDAGARQAILAQVASLDPPPDFAVLTGDIVLTGKEDKDWNVFDSETKQLRDKVKLFPILGNHDLRGDTGQKKFVKHFSELSHYPILERNGWYSMSYDNSLFLMLDSQSSYQPESLQGSWLRNQLKRVPDDLNFLFVVAHHPFVTHPDKRFTNMPVCGGTRTSVNAVHDVEHSEQELRQVIEDFARAHASIKVVVFSGHNHNYERYVEKGITYIVTAGGGATPYPIKRSPNDFYQDTGPTFHYCAVTIEGQKLTFRMYKLNPKDGTWKQRDEFHLPPISP